jgi:hypothetical protein
MAGAGSGAGQCRADRYKAALPFTLETVTPGAAMHDDQMLKVLEEMRDLLRQNVGNYQEALRNQQESINLQKAGLRRVRVILAIATGALILAVAMLVMLLLRVVARLS